MPRDRYTRRADGVMRTEVTAKISLDREEVAALRRGQARQDKLRDFCESLLRDEIGRLLDLDDEIQSEKGEG